MLKHKGIDIDVTHNGKFTATVNEIDVTTDTFDAMRDRIDREKARKKKKLALPVIGILEGNYSARTDSLQGTLGAGTFRGVNRHTRDAIVDGIPKNHELEYIIADTPANRALLAQRIAADKLDAKIAKLTLYGHGSDIHLGRNAEDYDDVMTEIEKKHAQQVAGECCREDEADPMIET